MESNRDTPPAVEDIQVSLIQGADTAKRISSMRSLSQTVINLSRRAIQRANPEKSERELEILFVSHHYGSELAFRLQEHLNRNRE
jgi:hypothetical protein